MWRNRGLIYPYTSEIMTPENWEGLGFWLYLHATFYLPSVKNIT